MNDIVTPVPPEEVRYVIKKCLENAALVNYTRISEFAKIEGKVLVFLESFPLRIYTLVITIVVKFVCSTNKYRELL